MLPSNQTFQNLFLFIASLCCTNALAIDEKIQALNTPKSIAYNPSQKPSHPDNSPQSDTPPQTGNGNKKLKYKWLNNQNCDPVIIKPLSDDFKLGLVAFKVKCQDNQERILSANVSQILMAYKSNLIKNKNDRLSFDEITATEFEAFNLHKIPATKEQITSSTLKKNINAGSVIFYADLETPNAWKSGSLIEISSSAPNILATTKGVALENAKLNQPSKAKIGNKIISGIVKQKDDGTFFLNQNQ